MRKGSGQAEGMEVIDTMTFKGNSENGVGTGTGKQLD